MVDLLLAGASVVLLVVVTVALVRSDGLTPGRIAGAVALIVVATGTFAVTLYRQQTAGNRTSELPIATAAPSPATQRSAAAALTVAVPMGTGDKLPQGAFWLDPPRAGTDAYTGDVSLLCYTPGKTESVQNCAGADQRTWTVEPIGGRATVGTADGDPFAEPGACDKAVYQVEYVELAADKSYCLRRKGDDTHTYAMRVPAFPAQQPLPTVLTVEIAALGR